MPPRRRERDLPAGLSRLSGTGRCAQSSAPVPAPVLAGAGVGQPRLTEGGGKLSPRGIVARLATQLRVAQLRQRLLFLAALLFSPSGARPRACTSRGHLVHGEDLTDLGPTGSGCGGGEEACPGQDPRRPRPPPHQPPPEQPLGKVAPSAAASLRRLGPTGDETRLCSGGAPGLVRETVCEQLYNSLREAVGEQRWYEPASVYPELEEDSYGQ